MSSNIGAIVAVNTAMTNHALSLGRRATEDKRRKDRALRCGRPVGKAEPEQGTGYGAESFSFHVTCYKYR